MGGDQLLECICWFESEPRLNVSQNDYIRLIAGPAYKKMITDAGGRDSDGWRGQHDDLVKRYDALRKE